jgi:hypothetical protein
MPDTLVVFAIFAALTLLAILFAKVTRIALIVLFVAALGSGVAFLSLGLHLH